MEKQTRREKYIEETKKILVNTPDGKVPLFDLCKHVKESIAYYNFIEVRQKSIKEPFKVVKKYHDWGFVFNDGFEIWGVAEKHWKLFANNIIEKRKRK